MLGFNKRINIKSKNTKKEVVMKKTKQLILRWSLVTGGLIALFWAIWYLITGGVPVVTSIKISSNWTYVLPFGVSRWWDILIGIFWSTIIILLLTSKKLKGDEDRIVSLIFGLVAGLIAGLGVSLGVGLIVGLVASLVAGLSVSLGASLIAGLGAGLIAGLIASLIAGLGAGLITGLIAGLGAGLGALIKVISTNFWTKVWNWLLVK